MKKNRRQKKLSEDASYEIALKDHPEFRRAMDRDNLPEETIQPNGEPMSPRLHLTMHSIVERQLAADDPPGVAAIARQLEELGVSHHDVRHYIGQAVTDQIWAMTHHHRAFDREEYFAKLRKLVEAVRRGDAGPIVE
ncbi:MAG: DUF1841 family protein [Thermoguttaceae bacterium]